MKRLLSIALLTGVLLLSSCGTPKAEAKGSLENLQSMAESSYLPQIEGTWFEDEYASESEFLAGAHLVNMDEGYLLVVSLYPTRQYIQGVSAGYTSIHALAVSIAGNGLLVYYSCDEPIEEVICDSSRYKVEQGIISETTLAEIQEILVERSNTSIDDIELPPTNPYVQIEDGAGQYYDVIIE